MQPVYIQRIASIHPPKDHSPGNNRPYLQAYESDYKDIITNATLRRRMSRIVKMGVACGLECMGELSPEKIQGIITATGLGCLTDTEKFLNNNRCTNSSDSSNTCLQHDLCPPWA